MNKQAFLSFIILCGIAVTFNAQTITYRLENSFLTRTLEVNNGVLVTQSILNKLSEKTLTPLSCEEFALRISGGTDKEGTDRTLTAKDFTVLSVSNYNLAPGKKGHGYKFILNNKQEALSVTVCYELADNDSFCCPLETGSWTASLYNRNSYLLGDRISCGNQFSNGSENVLWLSSWLRTF